MPSAIALLRNEGKAFEILSEKEQLTLIKKIMKKHKMGQIPAGMVLKEIGLAKNNLVIAEEFKDIHAGDATMAKIAKVYETYEKEKEKRMQLDLNDLLMETYLLLKEKEETRRKYQEQYTHILVDEFQDTNPAQMEILRLLVGGRNDRTSFWICGDDWQSHLCLYRGIGFKYFELCKDVSRMQPVRFGHELPVDAADPAGLPEPDPAQHQKDREDLEDLNPEGEGVLVLEAANEEDEALQIVNEIKEPQFCKGLCL